MDRKKALLTSYVLRRDHLPTNHSSLPSAVARNPFIAEFRPRLHEDTLSPLIRTNSPMSEGIQSFSPPVCIKYASTPRLGSYLAVADEFGYVSILDTARSAPMPEALFHRGTGEATCKAYWHAHRNCIFDLIWCRDDTRIVTASGDQSLCMFDTSRAVRLVEFEGHGGSVKTVCALDPEANTLVSGARDGTLAVWDTRGGSSRAQGQGGVSQPVCCLAGAHERPKAQPRGRKRPVNSDANSVTSVVSLQHLGTPLVVSAGSGDGLIKVWDLRRTDKPAAQAAAAARRKPETRATAGPRPMGLHPVAQVPCRDDRGITSLAVDPTGRFLAAVTKGSLSDPTVTLFSASRPEAGPWASLCGNRVQTFFVKGAFSPDGLSFACGSSDNSARVWDIRRPMDPPVCLEAHNKEVTCATWSHVHPMTLATCADDSTVSLWSLQRGEALSMGPMPMPQRRTAGAQLRAETAQLQASQASASQGSPWPPEAPRGGFASHDRPGPSGPLLPLQPNNLPRGASDPDMCPTSPAHVLITPFVQAAAAAAAPAAQPLAVGAGRGTSGQPGTAGTAAPASAPRRHAQAQVPTPAAAEVKMAAGSVKAQASIVAFLRRSPRKSPRNKPLAPESPPASGSGADRPPHQASPTSASHASQGARILHRTLQGRVGKGHGSRGGSPVDSPGGKSGKRI